MIHHVTSQSSQTFLPLSTKHRFFFSLFSALFSLLSSLLSSLFHLPLLSRSLASTLSLSTTKKRKKKTGTMSINLEKHRHPQKKKEKREKVFVEMKDSMDKQRWEIQKLMADPVSLSTMIHNDPHLQDNTQAWCFAFTHSYSSSLPSTHSPFSFSSFLRDSGTPQQKALRKSEIHDEPELREPRFIDRSSNLHSTKLNVWIGTPLCAMCVHVVGWGCLFIVGV